MRAYIDPSPHAASRQIHVPYMGLHERMPAGVIQHGGAGSRYPALLMVFHTAASVWPAGGKVAPAQSQLVLWPTQAAHRYGNPTASWDHSWIQIDGDFVDRALHASLLPLGVPISAGENAAVPMRYLQMIYDELHAHRRQDPDMLEHLLALLLHDVARRHRSTRTAAANDPRLESARQFIESRFDQPFKLSLAARQAHMSPSHFCARFTRQFGVSPGQYALRLRLLRAAQLLANQDLAVFQVAHLVGFADPLYFSRLFRKRYGQSPAQFRTAERPRAEASAGVAEARKSRPKPL